MIPWRAYPSGWSTGVNSVPDTFVDAQESIGTTGDTPATDIDDNNSFLALLKGIVAGLGVGAGSGDATVNDHPKNFGDPLVALGEMSDAPASDTGNWSAISLLKGILTNAGFA